MGCRRMLGVEDRAAIMAGVDVGLSQTRIAHLIGRSPSVVCREIARHTGPDGQYRAEEADKAARAARRRPKMRLLDCDEVLRRRVISDLSQGHTPRQISGRLREEGACQFFCVWGLEVGGDSVGVGGGELGEGLFPVGGGVSLDEAGVSCSFVGGFASVCEALGGAFVFDVADGEP